MTAGDDTAELLDAADGGEAGTRRCGRCRGRFPIAADANPGELLDWWSCEPCSDALLPGRHRAAPSAVDRHEHPA